MISKHRNLHPFHHFNFSEAEQPSRRKQEYDLKVYVNQAAETTENLSRGRNIQNK